MRYDDPARPTREGVRLQLCGAALPCVTLVAPEGVSGAWLACIHAERAFNRYGYHSAVLQDLGRFAQEWLEDPEGALARHFGYKGPEEAVAAAPAPARVASLPDLWED